jgi:hypothetical protein
MSADLEVRPDLDAYRRSVAARESPTADVSPALLQPGDLIYPDIEETPTHERARPFRVTDEPHRERHGWLLDLDSGCLLYVPLGGKVRTERRGSPHTLTPDDQDLLADGTYPEGGWTDARRR